MADIGLSEAEIDEVTGIIWNSGTIEPVLPSDYELRSELLAQRDDLGDGDENGLVLQATKKFCDGLGNCRTWFFHKKGGKWRSLADLRMPGEGISVFEFAIQKASADKPPNLVLIRHSMDDNYPTRVWKFEENSYTPKYFSCWHPARKTFVPKPCVDFEPVLHMPPQTWLSGRKREADIFKIPLDFGDGKENGLAVQGRGRLCGATANCQTWFYRKVAGKWEHLQIEADEDGTLASMFATAPPTHNGLFELILAQHLNAFEVPFAQLWFDGEKFHVHQMYCRYNETGEVLAGDCE